MASILVVDDESSIRSLLRTFLGTIGHEVTVAENAATGLAAFKALRPDIVLTDMVMPDQSGVDLLRAIKREDEDVPVFILTGKPSVDAAVECLKCGATDYILKPLDLNRLRDSIESCMHDGFGQSGSGDSIAADCANLLPGFAIKRILGIGNSSTVYLADMTMLDRSTRPVALKILKLDNVTDQFTTTSMTTRFSREAEIIAKIHHPNIVYVLAYDVDARTRIPYMALELVVGKTLKEMMRDFSLDDWPHKVHLLRQATDALVAIHAMGICHRDIKPQNMLVDRENNLKLTDFGIVQVPDSELTLPYQLFGTPLYMAPEAYDTSNLTPLADLFSLGVVAYELLTGRRPFDGDTYGEISDCVQHKPAIDPAVHYPDIPPALRDILARLLQKTPADRYPSAATLLADLDAVLASTPVSPLPAAFHVATWA